MPTKVSRNPIPETEHKKLDGNLKCMFTNGRSLSSIDWAYGSASIAKVINQKWTYPSSQIQPNELAATPTQIGMKKLYTIKI